MGCAETYILRYLLHCHEEIRIATHQNRCLDSGLEKLIREPQSAQNTIPAKRCEYVPLGSFFGFLLRRRCALSHVSWSMIASWVFLNTILSSGVAARRFFSLKFSRMLLHSTVWPRYSCRSEYRSRWSYSIDRGRDTNGSGPLRDDAVLRMQTESALFLRKRLPDLCKTGTAGCHIEDPADNGSCFLIYMKSLLITGNPLITVGYTAAAPFAILHPRFEHSADFIAGILCVPLVHDIQERDKVIVCGIGTVNIVDSDEPNTL